MCGIAGYLSLDKSVIYPKNLIEKMTTDLSHRGPDNKNILYDKYFALGHSRLSIRDLSVHGNQPMISQNNRYIITYNGEVYNESELKKNLKVKLQSKSDTEIILETIATIGFEKTIKIIDGMFAIAVYDKKDKKLYLARDRAGIKPLYWLKNKSFAFASEIKSLKNFPTFSNTLNLKSLEEYLKYDFVNNSKSIFEDIEQVLPGEIITIDNDLNLQKKKYFNIYDNFQLQDWSKKTEIDLFFDFNKKITNSVKSSMVSDVEVGSFLSGGIDSALISSIMQKNSTKKIKTFCLSAKNLMTEENVNAKNIAEFIGSKHFNYKLITADIEDYLSKMTHYLDEPFADTSNINTYFISKKAKEYVNVVLSGDGGDELFGGYNRYLNIKNKFLQKSNFKNILKKNTAQIINQFPPKIVNFLGSFIGKDNLFEISENLLLMKKKQHDESYFYDKALSNSLNLNQLVKFNPTKNNKLSYEIKSSDPVDNFMLADIYSFLPSRVLTKVDRESMRNSLEVRIPFLTNDIMQFSLNLPNKYKILNNEKKYVLKKTLLNYLPAKFIMNEKMGFGLRKQDLLCKVLGEANQYFNDKSNIENAMLNFNYVQNLWTNFLYKKDKAHGKICWNLLVYLKWFKHNH